MYKELLCLRRHYRTITHATAVIQSGMTQQTTAARGREVRGSGSSVALRSSRKYVIAPHSAVSCYAQDFTELNFGVYVDVCKKAIGGSESNVW